MSILGLKNKSREQRAKEKTDVQRTDLILAELSSGGVILTTPIAARLKARGHNNIEASKPYGRPSDPALADAARRRD